ncbi:hypothetical protein PG991_014932 [Apiospora marii]|uniref:C2H2-type domain-containing protein n=1 Tax=Apiospora marii TaxID=335849 RepID=A0ABR1R478_9PEZI
MAADIPLYNEPPCVHCGKSTDMIGQFLDHAKQHNNDTINDSKAKNEYTQKRCDELRTIRDERLGSEESKASGLSASSKKRKSAPSKKRKRATANRRSTSTEVAHIATSREQVEGDSLSTRSDGMESHHNPRASSRPNSNSTNSSIPDFSVQQLPHNFPPPPANTNTSLQTGFAGSGGVAGGDISISCPSSLVATQTVNTLPQLGTAPLMTQDAFFNHGATTGSTRMLVPPLPHHGATAQYTAMEMGGFMGGAVYDGFSPIVNALNFAMQ